jgi:hypothetical protein
MLIIYLRNGFTKFSMSVTEPLLQLQVITLTADIIILRFLWIKWYKFQNHLYYDNISLSHITLWVAELGQSDSSVTILGLKRFVIKHCADWSGSVSWHLWELRFKYQLQDQLFWGLSWFSSVLPGHYHFISNSLFIKHLIIQYYIVCATNRIITQFTNKQMK